ncbi:MAG: hypothetical protein AB1642_09225 [Pseudomonadota bacterium]
MLVRLRGAYGEWATSAGYLLILLVGLEFDTPEGWRISAALVAAVAFVAWLASLRRARAVADTPTSSVASAAQGYVELLGRGRPPGGEPLRAPLNGLPCLWYRYQIERRQDDKWVTQGSGESTDSFLLDDGTGRCLIDPEGAEILPRGADVWRDGDYRYTQSVLVVDDSLYALGAFRTLNGDSLDLSVAADVKHLLAEWKKDMPRLLERFDLDGNGTLDLREWQLARSQARREVERSHRELRAAPDTHVLGRPADGRLFLISALPPEKIAARYTRWAVAHVAIFLVALGAVAWGWAG